MKRRSRSARPDRRLQDLAAYLTRHGFVPSRSVRADEVGASGSLLQLIHDENMSLAVAGAYGHSRLGELDFGGVTHGLLTESPICRLFPHRGDE